MLSSPVEAVDDGFNMRLHIPRSDLDEVTVARSSRPVEILATCAVAIFLGGWRQPSSWLPAPALTSPERDAAVVRAAVDLGRALGVPVIAEGIESRTQLRDLRRLDCPLGQGYLFAKPLRLAEAERLIEQTGVEVGPAREALMR